MIKLNDELLAEAGFGRLSANLKQSTLAALYSVLEGRVGIRIGTDMTPDELAEFEKYFDRGDDDGAMEWLEAHVPDHRALVQEEFRTLFGALSNASKWLVPIVSP